jgi:hypothetical protein
MSQGFGVQKYPAYGSYGEFSVGAGASRIRAQYLLTKIKPGLHGLWENQLASQMAPWREIFRIEELSFEELIQRDLDDSRVAHDLIPYLLGETGQHARFFPPILAVLVPKKMEGRSGIAPQYPTPATSGEKLTFGDLFDFQKMVIDGHVSPLAQINYNPQRTAMVIVDGQHRAMAVLALHRQLNKSWGSDPFAPYYDHIQISPETVAHIELPVCILFFPDLNEGESEFKDAGIDLVSVCREIFTIVNKQAKQVSKSRELLLDDEDFAAFMMRRTLTRFKDRPAPIAGSARIYSFAFGDSEADNGSQVMAGHLEFCSAVALHKMHAVTGFSLPAAFSLTKSADVTDGRNVRNPARPVEILTGSSGLPAFQSLSRRSAKTHNPPDVEFVTSRIGALTDAIMLPLFDNLRPFTVHNQAMRDLLEALSDSTAKADPVQSKVRALLFDGTSNRNVFDEHVARLKERASELKLTGEQVPSHVITQLSYCEAVNKALTEREDAVKLRRAYLLFNIETTREKPLSDQEIKVLKQRARAIFDTVSTQAFQIGYLMAVLTQVERMLPDAAIYDQRLAITEFVSSLFLAAMNVFFSTAQGKHRTLTGYVVETRAKAFEQSEPGFRGLLAATNVRELNEKQWEFFRYVVFEVVHSKLVSSAMLEILNVPENAAMAALFRQALPSVVGDTDAIRNRYFEAAFRTAANTPEFKRSIDLIEMQAKTSGKTEADIKQIIEKEVSDKRTAVFEICKNHLKASLGAVSSQNQTIKRLSPTAGAVADEGEAAETEAVAESDSTNPAEEDLNVALVAEDLRHQHEFDVDEQNGAEEQGEQDNIST